MLICGYMIVEPAKAAPPTFSFKSNAAPASGATTPAAPAPAPAPAPTFQLGGTTAVPPAASSATPAAGAGTAAPAPATTFSFGVKPATSTTPATTTATTATAPAASTSAGLAAGAAAIGTTTSQAKTTVSVPSLLKGKTLEDIVNGWSSSLDERVREFTNLAAEVKAWDSVLIQNGDEISKLYNSLQALDPVSNTISESLDYVESQQKEMSNVLDGYEAQLDEMLAGRAQQQQQQHGILGSSSSSSANSERERAYQLAESLNNQLDDLSRSLTALINEVNSLSPSTSASAGGDAKNGASSSMEQDPVGAIAAILNAHLSSLAWIEKTVESLNDQVSDLEGRMKTASNGKWNGLTSTSRNATSASTPGRYGFTSPQGNGLIRSTTTTNQVRYGTPSRFAQGSVARGSVFGATPRR